jgi:ABC-type lipoprotein export system ATPase subunit
VTVLDATGLAFSVRGRRLLDGMDVVAGPGDVVAVTGPSGTGKSCLLAMLAGLAVPEEGTVRVLGRPLVGADPALRRRIGLVLQGYGLVSLLTAAENVEVTLQAAGAAAGRAAIVERASAALARVGMAGRADTLVENLSGGQRQRIAVARAVVGEPVLLLADEPTAALDPRLRDIVTGVLLAEAARGAAVVIATHDPTVVEVATSTIRLA